MTDLLRDDNGNVILQFDHRGYLNATALAKHFNKTWAQVARGDDWKEDVEMAMEEFGLSLEQIIHLGKTGRYSTQV